MNIAKIENIDALGPASIDADQLAAYAAASLQQPSADTISACAVSIPMPSANMTTGGLWRIEGTVAGDTTVAEKKFSIVAKMIQSPLLWSGIHHVPEAFRGPLERNYPWRTEALVYASDLAHELPEGGRLPEIFGIEELDPPTQSHLDGRHHPMPRCPLE